MNNSITIIVPVVKTKYLEITLESINKQIIQADEVLIIVDNPNIDVNYYENKFKNFKFIKLKSNLGKRDPSLTWEYGIKLSKSEYFSIIGDDDYIGNNYIKELKNIINNNININVFRTSLKLVDDNNNILTIGTYLKEKENWFEYLYNRNVNNREQSIIEFCFKKNEFIQEGGFVHLPLAYGTDDLTILKLAMKSCIVSTNLCCAYWRVHKNSITGGKYYFQKIIALHKMYMYEKKLIKEKNNKDLNVKILLNNINKRDPLNYKNIIRFIFGLIIPESFIKIAKIFY